MFINIKHFTHTCTHIEMVFSRILHANHDDEKKKLELLDFCSNFNKQMQYEQSTFISCGLEGANYTDVQMCVQCHLSSVDGLNYQTNGMVFFFGFVEKAGYFGRANLQNGTPTQWVCTSKNVVDFSQKTILMHDMRNLMSRSHRNEFLIECKKRKSKSLNHITWTHAQPNTSKKFNGMETVYLH